jgi:hypothetical protein
MTFHLTRVGSSVVEAVGISKRLLRRTWWKVMTNDEVTRMTNECRMPNDPIRHSSLVIGHSFVIPYFVIRH